MNSCKLLRDPCGSIGTLETPMFRKVRSLNIIIPTRFGSEVVSTGKVKCRTAIWCGHSYALRSTESQECGQHDWVVGRTCQQCRCKECSCTRYLLLRCDIGVNANRKKCAKDGPAVVENGRRQRENGPAAEVAWGNKRRTVRFKMTFWSREFFEEDFGQICYAVNLLRQSLYIKRYESYPYHLLRQYPLLQCRAPT